MKESEAIVDILTSTKGASILGSGAFVDEISATYLLGKEDRNIPALRELTRRPTMAIIAAEVKAEFPDDEKLARRVNIHLCHKQSGQKLGKIGECFNVRDTAITEASRRFVKELETNKKLRDVVERIKCRLRI